MRITETMKFLKIQRKNHENHENHKIPLTGIKKIMFFLEIHYRIMKIKKNKAFHVKIIKIIEFNKRIKQIMEIKEFH